LIEASSRIAVCGHQRMLAGERDEQFGGAHGFVVGHAGDRLVE
jgi:hypothetical protein